MARVPAVGAAPIGRERVGLGVSAILTFRARSSRLHRCASWKHPLCNWLRLTDLQPLTIQN